MKKIITMALLYLITTAVIAGDDFPGRALYPEIPYMTLDELYDQRDSVVFIDARSKYEYETLRIRNAVSIPLVLSSKEFKRRMLNLREKHPTQKFVFYCNGHNCMKSYKATKRSLVYVGLKNVYAFDAGIFDWASKYPMDAMLLGEILVSPKKLISKERFKSHFLDAEVFIKKPSETDRILDIRDRIERDGFYVFSGYETSISLNLKDRLRLDDYFKKVKNENKPLYIYDMVGKQVRWFQYYIESKGIKEYYFMKGGSNAFFDIPIKNLMD